MANATLQSFNVFLTERLTAAAVDIYGFVEKAVVYYQEEVYRTKLENQRLQRLLDLVYKPEIRLHRADSRQIDLPTPTQEVCGQEQQVQKEFPVRSTRSKTKGLNPGPAQWRQLYICHTVDTLTQIVTAGKHEENEMPDSLTQTVTVGERNEFKARDRLTQVTTDVKQPTTPTPTPTPTEEIPNKEQVWSHIMCQDEPGPSQIKEEQEEQKDEVWINGSEEPPSAEDSDDGDALTKELIKTVQQLEDCRAAEEGNELDHTPADDPEHSEEKTSTTLYRCHICNFIFTKKTVLTWHLKTHESKSHDSKGNFDCHICGKHIPCQSNLQNHMRVHTGERPYSCHFCGKCFKLKGHMTEHIRTHTGEKPFSCHICDKSFNRGSTLRKHVLAKHKEERPYKCEDCDELFTERLMMKRHMRKVHGIKLSTSQSPA